MIQQFVVSEILGQLKQLGDEQWQVHKQMTFDTTDLHLTLLGLLTTIPLKAKVMIEIPDNHPLLMQLITRKLTR